MVKLARKHLAGLPPGNQKRRNQTACLPACLPAACPPALSHSRLNRVISHRLTGRGAGVVCLPSDRFHNHSLKNNIPGLQGDSYCISREEEKKQRLTRAGYCLNSSVEGGSCKRFTVPFFAKKCPAVIYKTFSYTKLTFVRYIQQRH